MPSVPPVVYRIFLVVAALGSGALLVMLDRPGGEWGIRLRRRFVLGVPWGTLLTVGVVLAVYLFLQGGWWHWNRPLVVPFRAWSYFYPLGVLVAGLSHAGPNHLVGNLTGAIVFGTVAEFAWGHFPATRGSQSFRSLPENPFVRILAVPVSAVLAAVFTGAFGLGPVVGFSGVVFAYTGFALVRYPIATVVLLVAGDVVDLALRALRDPVEPASAGVNYGSPWWAGIAIQGHAIGLLLGIVAGAVVVRHRDALPSASHLWLAALALAANKGLWAVYIYRGGDSYLLFRAAGLALLFVLATLVTAAVVASDRTLVGSIDLSSREAALGLVVAVLLALSVVAVPYNLLTVGNPAGHDEGAAVEVRDYTVFYAEGVQHQLVSAYDVPLYNTSSVRTSGVILANPDRGIWWTVASKGRLAFAGRTTVRIGGVGWREVVVANRTGWSTVGGPPAYKVFLHERGASPRLAFTSDPATAEPVVAGRNVSLVPTDAGFAVAVTRNDTTLGRAPVPAPNGTATAGGLTFVREKSRLYVVYRETRVRVAQKESYG